MDLSDQTFVAGAELKNGRFILGTQDPGLDIETQPHTGWCYWTRSEGWVEIGLAGTLTVNMTTNAMQDFALASDATGFITSANGDAVEKEYIKDLKGNPFRGVIRCVRRVGEEVFAAGVDRVVFKRTQDDDWTDVSTPEMKKSKSPTALQGIDGFGPNEVYAAGWNGEIWSCDGNDWVQRKTPTDIILNDICAGENECVAVGLAGTVLIGRGSDWQQVQNHHARFDFWSVRFFKGAYYLSATNGIYKLEDGKITSFRDLDEQMRTAFVLTIGPSGLWSVGTKDVALYDGEKWETIGQA